MRSNSRSGVAHYHNAENLACVAADVMYDKHDSTFLPVKYSKKCCIALQYALIVSGADTEASNSACN